MKGGISGILKIHFYSRNHFYSEIEPPSLTTIAARTIQGWHLGGLRVFDALPQGVEGTSDVYTGDIYIYIDTTAIYIYIYCNGKGVVCESTWIMLSFGGKNKHIFCVDMPRLVFF